MTAMRADRLVSGPAGTLVYTTRSPTIGHVEFVVLDPFADIDLLHEWVTRPESRFWGLADLPRDELRDLYLYVDGLPTHHAFVVRRDGTRSALLQAYAPEDDPLGDVYDTLPGDVGLHFLIGDRGAPVPRFSLHLIDLVAEFVFSRVEVDRLVVEPDVRNERAVAFFERKAGFVLGPQVRLPDKTGQLAFLTRERWEQRRPRA
ncbi:MULTISPECIES: GNAT family N-acetyltransferase [Bacteria]|uniref:GNAT family N-acetyltransferase n=1 Tax=Bacteria TaxID=2 RepID=UPI003C7B5EE3